MWIAQKLVKLWSKTKNFSTFKMYIVHIFNTQKNNYDNFYDHCTMHCLQ